MDDKSIFEAIEEISRNIKLINDRVETLDKKVSSMQMTLENDISKSIRIIAEGHTILERKLDESLTVNQEKELLLIRVTHLENEVRILRERIEGIA